MSERIGLESAFHSKRTLHERSVPLTHGTQTYGMGLSSRQTDQSQDSFSIIPLSLPIGPILILGGLQLRNKACLMTSCYT